MHILRIDPRRPDKAAMRRAAAILKSGGLVVFPTETAYGLACDPGNVKAVKRLFSVKKRDASKPLPLVAASSAQVRRLAAIRGLSAALASAFWPGPLSLVLITRKKHPSSNLHDRKILKTRHFAPGVVNRHGEIAVRVSPHPVASALARALGRPIVATSANRSGRPTLYAVPDILADLGILPDVVLDAGPLKKTPPSTLVRCDADFCQILREGPVSATAIRRALIACL